MLDNWKKHVVLFISSQTLSLLGTSLVQYAIMWYITLNTKSGIFMTIAIICGFLPTFFLSPFAGVWADRYNRKNLIVIADSFIAISTFILAILFFTGYGSIWLLFVMSSFRAIGSAIQAPAVGAFVPQLVPEEQLTKVNGINGSIQSLIMLVSPILSGALLTMSKIEYIFFIDVITALIAVMILLTLVKTKSHAKAQDQKKVGYFKDLHEGLLYIKGHSYVMKFFVFCAIFFFLATPVAFLTPLQVTRTFGSDVWRLTAIEITFSLGMMLGGILIATWGGFKNRIVTMSLSSIMLGLSTFALGIIPNFWFYLFFMVVSGVFIPFFNTPSTVLLQEKVDKDFLGRVFGVMGMIGSSVMPIGMLIFGPASDIIKIEYLLIVTGLLMFLQSFLLLGSKDLIEAGKQKQVEEQLV
jgi:DHA3 family macrolide efflux protein-like MFS transporter